MSTSSEVVLGLRDKDLALGQVEVKRIGPDKSAHVSGDGRLVTMVLGQTTIHIKTPYKPEHLKADFIVVDGEHFQVSRHYQPPQHDGEWLIFNLVSE
ncbi:hypothetical protein [Achromobacter piechaudii]|uniref:Uncharacterized protein n=1 Tax=Achromobacter piechaudii ATCC 43553 TaxID=742159 RepID=D4X8L3_9BURK|nr:hypothetical protein [Achromobacter piechaudii]EFF76881.1 hypothetical protein HMPREF0004_1810 [Achromobacter piechaudii ATCC 43553]